jgi:hypothetical protein
MQCSTTYSDLPRTFLGLFVLSESLSSKLAGMERFGGKGGVGIYASG